MTCLMGTILFNYHQILIHVILTCAQRFGVSRQEQDQAAVSFDFEESVSLFFFGGSEFTFANCSIGIIGLR